MILPLAACGTASPTSPSASPSDSASPSGELGSYYIAYALLGTDWILNYMEQRGAWGVKNAGDNKYDYYSADFSADTMQSGTQNMLNAGINGLMYYPAYPTLTPTVTKMCEDAKVPFVIFDTNPLPEQNAGLLASPMFAGFIASSSYDNGYSLGLQAVKDGYKNAICVGGHVGDISHDNRISGFTDAFATGGGKVVDEARCTDPSEAVQKASDSLNAHPEADCFFSTTGSYTNGALTAMKNYNRTDLMVYSVDIDTDLLKYVREGTMVGNGGAAVAIVLAAALLQNRLDGHPILDANGKAPWSDRDIKNIYVDASNADDFERCILANEILTPEIFHQFVWRYNHDVTWQTYLDFFNAYNLDYLVSIHGAA